MYWHVVAHGNHFAIAIEHRARIIAPLFDVGRKRGPAQRRAHFLRDGVIDVLENFQFDGIAPHNDRQVYRRLFISPQHLNY